MFDRLARWARNTLVGLTVVAAGCAGHDDHDAGRDVRYLLDTSAPYAQDVAVGLTDAQIVAIAAAVDTGEIDVGQVAMTHATDPGVQAFAAAVVNDHTTTQTELATLVTMLGITPASSMVSEQLAAQARAAVIDLQPRMGSDFDQAYVAEQLTLQAEVLSVFDTMILPDTTNAQLRTQLLTVRALVASHLAMAHGLASSVGIDAGVAFDGG